MKAIRNLLNSIKGLFLQLISATEGQGPSCTRLVYLLNGAGALFSAVLSTIGGVMVYCIRNEASTVYWGGVASLWTATLGFGAMVKRHQTNATRAIKTSRMAQFQSAPASSGD
jgi:uncharacterized membrane protein YuzA (DUF378 family)